MQNPLFPSDPAPRQGDPYSSAAIDSQPFATAVPGDPAVDMIRQKINALYAETPAEPVVISPVPAQVQAQPVQPQLYAQPVSLHQQFMNQLSASGKTPVEIQAAWHQYYVSLPEDQKYQVWQEFYVQNNTNPAYQQVQAAAPVAITPVAASNPSGQQNLPTVSAPVQPSIPVPAQVRDRQLQRHTSTLDSAADRIKQAMNSDNAAGLKKWVVDMAKNTAPAKSTSKVTQKSATPFKMKHHLQSLVFGLGMGAVVVFIFLFSFFNEFLIAPLIQPSRKANDTPVIVDVASTIVSGGPKVIIPKINLEIPTDYSQTTTDEKQIELALDKGIVHYPTTVLPGQAGNAAYFGHSSNNIFNPGKYKFAFVLLHELVEGDTFYLSNNGKTYAYKVFSKRIVQPSEVSVLLPVPGHPATATLITCDPPGTSINRLVVVGDQISPDAGGNAVPAPTPAPVQTASADVALPGNGPTLWSRIWASIF